MAAENWQTLSIQQNKVCALRIIENQRMIDKEDARLLTLEALPERRKQVVRVHRKGLGVTQIVKLHANGRSRGE